MINFFDGAIASYSLIHFPFYDFQQTLSEIVKTLKSGAPLMLMLQGGPRTEFKSIGGFDKSPIPILIISEADLIAELQRQSLDHIELWSRDPDLRSEIDAQKMHILARKQ